ncbi:MAG: flap endonuclease [Acidimicrobiaceae bacterium]|nr:flap endonuclease [Acidimicrobiaceae bacterium]
MLVHLIDGTYELFRFHYAKSNRDPRHGAQTGVANSMLGLLADGATHVGVATDHVIESFRNDMLDSYKDGSGTDPDLAAQFPELEELLELAGLAVWPQITHEADDGLASAAVVAAADPRVRQVLICTPDKDLSQCVTADGRIVQYDRRRQALYDYDGVIEKFGVPPESIPDYLGLVGDSADGFAGLPGWGAKSAATLLARYNKIEAIPFEPEQWDVPVRSAAKLAAALRDGMQDALLFRRIATVARDAPVARSVDELEWKGPRPGFDERCAELGAPHLAERAHELAAG